MARPTGADYQLAFQNPKSVFSEGQLRHALAAKTKLGLPKLMSGNFAVVCNLRDGRSAWAVRAFVKETPDLHQRYSMISNHLASRSTSQSSLVEFRYVPKGILVNGTWHPIVIMDWVPGDQLDLAVEKRLDAGQSLWPLIKAWLSIADELNELGIAHGDLQHGNVLADGDSLKLVDYDGMFVPTMAGMAANEHGHPNFQHPSRSAQRFDATLDRFSELVIFTALCALEVDPGLWKRHNMRADALLFRKADLENPHASPLFNDLLSSKDLSVRHLAHELLDSVVSNTVPASLRSLANGFGGTVAPVADPSGWWKSQASPEPQLSNEISESGTPIGANWTRAYIPRQPSGNGMHVANQYGEAGKPYAGGASWIRTVANETSAGKPFLVASRSSTTVHLVSCEAAQRISTRNVIAFASISDARKSGFVPCKVCKPDRVLGDVKNQLHLSTLAADRDLTRAPVGDTTQTTPAWNPAKVGAVLRSPNERPTTPSMPPGFPNARVDLGSQVTLAYENGTLDVVRLVRSGGQQKGMNQIAEDTALGQAMLGAYVGDTISYLQLGRLCEATIVDVS